MKFFTSEQKPHLKIKCPCGANFALYEWTNDKTPEIVSKFLEKHPCGHNLVIGSGGGGGRSPTRTAAKRLLVEEVPTGTGTFRTIYDIELKYNCARCKKSLDFDVEAEHQNGIVKADYYCKSCKTGFNIRMEGE